MTSNHFLPISEDLKLFDQDSSFLHHDLSSFQLSSLFTKQRLFGYGFSSLSNPLETESPTFPGYEEKLHKFIVNVPVPHEAEVELSFKTEFPDSESIYMSDSEDPKGLMNKGECDTNLIDLGIFQTNPTDGKIEKQISNSTNATNCINVGMYDFSRPMPEISDIDDVFEKLSANSDHTYVPEFDFDLKTEENDKENTSLTTENVKKLAEKSKKMSAPARPKRSRAAVVSKPQPTKMISSRSKKISKVPKSSKQSSQKQAVPKVLLTRKIVKNFGKAIAAFSCSLTAKNLILGFINGDEERYTNFLQFIYEVKDTIEGNRRLKLLLQIQPEDDENTVINKKIFTFAARTFMSGYVYRWLWNSHVENKVLHAQLVGQVRIRIFYPELLDRLTPN